MRRGLIMLALLLNSCNSVYCEPAPEEEQASRPVGAAACIQFYDNGQHKAWAKCMGVGYK